MIKKLFFNSTCLKTACFISLLSVGTSVIGFDGTVHAEKKDITDSMLKENDNILYTVNAGTKDPTVIPNNEKLGILQSSMDQPYGEDAKTGFSWGIDQATKYAKGVRHGDDTNDVGLSYLYMADDVLFNKYDSILGYTFDVPQQKFTNMADNTYEVTVGFKHFWDNRLVNIMLEGQTVAADVELNNGQWESKTFVTEVTDGQLNVGIKSPRRDSSKQDPLINYIKVSTVKEKEKQSPYTAFTGVKGDLMYDTNGNKIQAHGGQIQKLTVDGVEKYYWIGEDKTYDYRPVGGIHMYSSTDLYNWTDEGVVLKTMEDDRQFETDDYFKTLYAEYSKEKQSDIFIDLDRNNTVMERPKMLYNEKTKKYVIWFHADGRFPGSDADYGKAKAGVAISDKPTGPFKLLGSYKLNYHNDPNGDYGFDGWNGRGSVRDMTLFKDDDQTAYVVYSSEGNKTTFVSKLSDDYTQLITSPDKAVEGKDFTRNFVNWSREAPAMFKYKKKYYIINSGLTGWAPNPAQYAVADHPMGPWTGMGDPSADWGGHTTYDTQSTNVIPVDPENGKYIYMGDRWQPWDLSESRYVWLPIEFLDQDRLAIRRAENWTLEELENKGLFDVTTDLVKTVQSPDDILPKLPKRVEITYGTKKQELEVEWELSNQLKSDIGVVKVKGKLKEINREFSHDVHVVKSDLVYFFDSGTKKSAFFESVKSQNPNLLNESTNQKFSEDNQAGYIGDSIFDNDTDYDLGVHEGKDLAETGWWANKGKSIDYRLFLKKGQYKLTTGYQEWWNAQRPMTVSIYKNKERLNESQITLNQDNKDVTNQQEFSMKADGFIDVVISKVGNEDPILSWLAVQSKDGSKVDAQGLQSLITNSETLIESNYQKEAWQQLHSIVEKAKAMLNDAAVTQAELDTMTMQLEQELVTIEQHKVSGQGTELTLNVKQLEILKIGKTRLLELSEVGSDTIFANQDINWAVQKPAIVEVDATNQLIAKKAGLTKVTATLDDGRTVSFIVRVTK
ncbi:hypothetical protein CBF34_10780 [Vagococcus penaei]|uniref:Uncharacterized protein n=1 Tax=Vagococcus penaei TaxID=633807 RepID=A0A1Q2D5G3_9ENTE|nr:Ig-like domain-containing protein [Vagococcus penaei]AQP53652.1 hypothetical protein BW732_04975 [Vagococcus penaei]RST98088.1 hypothetical protein CBF34_10780 [Vagococcus penaei]